MNETESKPVVWLRAKEAAAHLKFKSQRSVLFLAEKGEIQSKRERDPATNQIVVMLHAGDVERIAYQREHPVAKAGKPTLPALRTLDLEAAGQAANGKENQPCVATVPTLALPATLRIELVSSSPWLTIPQAAEYVQVSEECIVELVNTGRLRRLDFGRRIHGGR